MSLPSTLNYELIKTVSTILVPGAIASTPYILAASIQWPKLINTIQSNSAFTWIILLLILVGVGSAMENIGARIESHLDKWNKSKKHTAEWNQFLALEIDNDKEPVGHRYLLTILARMKFELGTLAGLLCAIPGLVWVHKSRPIMSDSSFNCSTGIIFAIAIWLLFEAQASSNLLASTRRRIMKIEEPEQPYPCCRFINAIFAIIIALIVLFSLYLLGARAFPPI